MGWHSGRDTASFHSRRFANEPIDFAEGSGQSPPILPANSYVAEERMKGPPGRVTGEASSLRFKDLMDENCSE